MKNNEHVSKKLSFSYLRYNISYYFDFCKLSKTKTIWICWRILKLGHKIFKIMYITFIKKSFKKKKKKDPRNKTSLWIFLREKIRNKQRNKILIYKCKLLMVIRNKKGNFNLWKQLYNIIFKLTQRDFKKLMQKSSHNK